MQSYKLNFIRNLPPPIFHKYLQYYLIIKNYRAKYKAAPRKPRGGHINVCGHQEPHSTLN